MLVEGRAAGLEDPFEMCPLKYLAPRTKAAAIAARAAHRFQSRRDLPVGTDGVTGWGAASITGPGAEAAAGGTSTLAAFCSFGRDRSHTLIISSTIASK